MSKKKKARITPTRTWVVGVPLLVECLKCGGRAVCKLESFDPLDKPFCPVCPDEARGELKVIRIAHDLGAQVEAAKAQPKVSSLDLKPSFER